MALEGLPCAQGPLREARPKGHSQQGMGDTQEGGESLLTQFQDGVSPRHPRPRVTAWERMRALQGDRLCLLWVGWRGLRTSHLRCQSPRAC